MSNKLYVGTTNLGDRQALLVRINDMLDWRWLSKCGRAQRARKLHSVIR
jgi:hypothetical protein